MNGPACAHLRVKWNTQEEGGRTRGWWACEMCHTLFIPKLVVDNALAALAQIKEMALEAIPSAIGFTQGELHRIVRAASGSGTPATPSQPRPHVHTKSCYKCGHDDCPCRGGYLHELPMCIPEPQGGKEYNAASEQTGVSATGASDPESASGLLASPRCPKESNE